MKLPSLRSRRVPERDDAADLAVQSTLERYAESISPDRETLDRGRAIMLEAVARRVRADATLPAGTPGAEKVRREPLVEGRASVGSGVDGQARPVVRPYRLTSMRPKLFAGFAAAAILVLATIGVAAETGPGQPFYRLRLSVEAIGLPPAGSTARVQADVTRAQARLDEIAGKVTGNDWNAAADAADAYAQLVAAMASPAPGTSPDAYRQQLLDQLNRLEALRTHAQGKESEALDRAIARLRQLLGQAPAATPGPTTAATDDGHGKGNDNGGNGNGGNGNGNGSNGNGNGNGNGPGGNGNGPGDNGGNGNGGNGNGNGDGGNRSGDGGKSGSGNTAAPTPAPTRVTPQTPAPAPTCQPKDGGDQAACQTATPAAAVTSSPTSGHH